MKEVDAVINQYQPLSQSCSSIYFTMESLNQIHFLYQYSLHYFLDTFNTVLTQNANLKDIKDPQQRLRLITKDLFYLAYYRLARGMLHADRIVLALLFAKIYLKGFFRPAEFSQIEILYKSLMNSNVSSGISGGDSKERLAGSKQMSGEQSEAVEYLHRKVPLAFSDLRKKIDANSDEFFRWLDLSTPELSVPESILPTVDLSAVHKPNGTFDLADVLTLIKRLLLVKSLRPDRFVSIAEHFVSVILGAEFVQQAERMLDLVTIVESEIKASTPVLMCSVAGYDASGRVEDLAVETNKQMISIAIGSSEGFTQAEKAINTSSKSGRWVLLKNVHLAPQWLVQLEKKLHNLQPHPSFRLFLSMEINPRLPSNLLRLGRCLVFEPPPGIRANLVRTLSVIPQARMNKSPAERSRLYFLLCWLHAIVQERLRYVPLGWSKTYEFNESDLRCGLDTIDVWLDTVAMGRTNLPPNKVPFNAIYSLLSECVYGGKIDNSFDRRLLNTFLKQLFCVSAFDSDYKIVSDEVESVLIGMPEAAIKKEEFVSFVEQQLARYQQTPAWLGLPNSAEKILLSSICHEVINKLLKLSVLDDDEDETLAYEEETRKEDVEVIFFFLLCLECG
jgi:dynein heavy chain 1